VNKDGWAILLAVVIVLGFIRIALGVRAARKLFNAAVDDLMEGRASFSVGQTAKVGDAVREIFMGKIGEEVWSFIVMTRPADQSRLYRLEISGREYLGSSRSGDTISRRLNTLYCQFLDRSLDHDPLSS
jgi:hypothetical protein